MNNIDIDLNRLTDLRIRLAFCAALVAGMMIPASAFAYESLGVMYVWNDRPAEKLNTDYVPNSLYRSSPSSSLAIGMVRTGPGRYTATFGFPHEPLIFPVISQVVAYGTDDVQCKFNDHSHPVSCSHGEAKGICTQVFVACYTASGGAANSDFVIQVAAVDSRSTTTHPFGDYGVLESAGRSSTIQNTWDEVAPGTGLFQSSGYFAFGSSAGSGKDPLLVRDGVGKYHIDFKDLGSKALGMAYVTAIGSDTSRCKLPGAPHTVSSTPTTLRIEVNCYLQDMPSDTDFTLLYDSYLLRWPGCQGARGYAYDDSTANYTPSRSVNTGQVSGTPGINVAVKNGTGVYDMLHSNMPAVNSSAYVVAIGSDSRYCKIAGWSALGNGTDVHVLCFDYTGTAGHSKYMESYQRNVAIGPD